MEHFESLSEILAALHFLGYTEHFYKRNGQLFLAGNLVDNIKDWVHCHWHDPATDETVWLNCCISSCGKKGVYID
jgi:hypothetical protein